MALKANRLPVMSAALGVAYLHFWHQLGWYGECTINLATSQHCHGICEEAARPNAAPVLMKIAKEPDDGYTSGSL